MAITSLSVMSISVLVFLCMERVCGELIEDAWEEIMERERECVIRRRIEQDQTNLLEGEQKPKIFCGIKDLPRTE